MTKTEKDEIKAKPIPSPDKLVKPGKKGDVELNEDELKKVAGGLKIKLT